MNDDKLEIIKSLKVFRQDVSYKQYVVCCTMYYVKYVKYAILIPEIHVDYLKKNLNYYINLLKTIIKIHAYWSISVNIGSKEPYEL